MENKQYIQQQYTKWLKTSYIWLTVFCLGIFFAFIFILIGAFASYALLIIGFCLLGLLPIFLIGFFVCVYVKNHYKTMLFALLNQQRNDSLYSIYKNTTNKNTNEYENQRDAQWSILK